MQIEIKTTTSKDYAIHCSWERRAETPEEIAARFLRMINSLRRIDPIFHSWESGGPPAKRLDTIRDHYASEVAEGISRNDWGVPQPLYGYLFSAWTCDIPRNRRFVVRCWAGATVDSVFPNSVTLETAASDKAGPDSSAISYRIFCAALLSMVEAWEPLDASAYPYSLMNLNVEKLYFPAPWIQYLCPWLAKKITPPASALVERLPDGGLLMSAATETFDVSNPKHIAVARDIGAAMAPLNEMPWPSGC